MKQVTQAGIALLLFFCSVAATADTLKGVIQNSTTNKPSVGDEVTLKRIGNGMEEVAKVKTNARGEFSFDVPPSQQPYVVWVQHQGVTYTQAALAGGPPVALRVFDAASSIKEITVADHAIALQTTPDGATLSGEEFYTVTNQSNPPRTLTGQHTFEIYLPEGANISETSVQTGKTQLKAALVPTSEKNKYAFVFPIRPGQTQFHVMYTVPYSGKLQIDPKTMLPTETLMVAVPDSMKVTPSDSALYQVKTNPQFKNVNFFIAKNVTSQQKTAVEVAGTGEMPREEQASAAPAANGRREPGEPVGPGGGLGVPNERPDPLHNGQWLFLGVLSLFLAAGATFVYTSNQNVPAATTGQSKPKDRSGVLLEAMKEEVFQLESDRLQGKISPQDYTTAKAALDKTLQRAVQRQAKA
ncbi:MAG TPA: hypothetical protein VKU42_00395 [Candidatus Angelobacter sp.]|nr:hypothetical protein [Candidatus Angelobacter sp.]